MPRLTRYLLALTLMILTAAVALAQPSGGGAGQATPFPDGPATRPPVIEDLQDFLENPETAMGELIQIVETYIRDFISENRFRIDRNVAELPDATRSALTRVLAVVLGVVTLIAPRSSKILAWLFLGAVVGAVVSQLPIGDELRQLLFRNDLRFMMEEPAGTIGLIAGFAIGGLIILSPVFFFTVTAAGIFAGITIALRVTGGAPSVVGVSMAVGGVLGFFLMAYVLGRGSLLIPLAIGSGLIVFGIGVGAGLMLPLMLGSGLLAAVRSPQGKARMKRVSLPQLTLQEGKVNVAHDKRNARAHLHEILPTMADDRDNPLIKR